MDRVIITKEPISLELLGKKTLNHPCCGAWVQFEGVVRNVHKGRKVSGLYYQCYEDMAKNELDTIIQESMSKWPIHEVLLTHRVGSLLVGEVSLVLLVLSPHRLEAFEATAYIVDELKKRVPIWKKEFYDDGSEAWTKCSH